MIINFVIWIVVHSAPCQEILLWYLSRSDPGAALSVLGQLSGLKQQGSQVAAGFHLRPGSDGGVKLSSRENSR